ncbi:MAG TPA: mechanosensitive ion channel family protein [candidate division Zixibacteria bacterium]|nr:mechanosensitive ion channel family protein [candidate division Zixibacteria bacterium]
MTFNVELAAKVTAIIVLALVAAWLARHAIRAGVRHLLELRAPQDEGLMTNVDFERRVTTLQTLGVRVAVALILIVATLMVLDQFEVSIGPAIAGLGVAGIAVGLGAQTLVKDWLAGIFIVIENQYSVGDVVQIAGVDGVVEDFSLRRTVLRNLDGTVHSVPNGHITVASNMTRGWARVNLDISVAYDTDIDRATEVINRVGRDLADDPEWRERLIEAPSVQRVNALSDSSVQLKILGQVRPAQQWAVAGELRKRILAAFASEGIEIPYPHQVLISRPAAGGGQPAGTDGERASKADGTSSGER